MVDETLYFKRVALYTRVSTDEQAIKGLSLDAQLSDLKKFAKEHKMQIIDTYVDAGISARKKIHNRKEFMRMIDDVKKDKVDMILFIKLDRWFRNVADYYKYQEILEKHHVTWKATQENYDTSSANGRLHINIKLSIDQDEADRTSERIKFVQKDRLSRGEVITGRVPYGYKRVNGKIILDSSEKVQLVKDIFNLYEYGNSRAKILIFLRENYNIFWESSRVGRMLKYEIYTGTFLGIDGICDPIISKEQFEKVQILQKNNIKSTPTGRVYPFSGLALCPCCKRGLVGSYDGRKTDISKYVYRCNNYTFEKTCTFGTSIREKIIEDYMLNHLETHLRNYPFDCELKQKKENRNKPKINKNSIKKKLSKLKELFLNDLISIEEYKNDYQRLNKLLENNEEPKNDSNIKKFEELKKVLQNDYISIYKTLSREDQKLFWKSIIKAIHLDINKNITHIEFL